MGKDAIKVLRAAKDTQTRLRFNNGVPEHRLNRVGSGRFLPGVFSEISDAKAFGCSELQRDPSAILYIVTDNQILDMLMDQEYQTRRQKRDSVIYTVASSAAVLAISLGVSLFVMPFTSTLAHSLFTGVMTLAYLMVLYVFGTRKFIHALLFFGIIIVLLTFLAPAIQELMSSSKAPDTVARKIV